MCLHRSDLRSAPGLPEGWTYVFTYASQDRALDSFRGLRIVAKNGKTYFNVERALNGRAAKTATLKKDVFYKHVGLSGVIDPKYPHMSSDVSGTIGNVTSNLQVGSRCYAQFTNGYYYWGEIVNVNSNGAQRTYDVQFDDGDFLAGIHELCVETEETAFLGGVAVPNLLGQEQQSQFLGLLDLHAQRCKTCTLCRRLDCGRCHSCRINADSSTSRRFACIRKVGICEAWHASTAITFLTYFASFDADTTDVLATRPRTEIADNSWSSSYLEILFYRQRTKCVRQSYNTLDKVAPRIVAARHGW